MCDNKGNFIKGIDNKKLAYDRITIHTIDEANKALTEDLAPREHLVIQNIKISLNQNQFDALVSYVYNTGGSSTLYRLINTKASKESIEKWFNNNYIKAGGKILPGLIRRRKEESILYFKQ
jgi:lysozyme